MSVNESYESFKQDLEWLRTTEYTVEYEDHDDVVTYTTEHVRRAENLAEKIMQDAEGIIGTPLTMYPAVNPVVGYESIDLCWEWPDHIFLVNVTKDPL